MQITVDVLCMLAGAGLSRGSARGFASMLVSLQGAEAYTAEQLTAGLCCCEAIAASAVMISCQTAALYFG